MRLWWDLHAAVILRVSVGWLSFSVNAVAAKASSVYAARRRDGLQEFGQYASLPIDVES
jgi:hypothetical protein